MEIIGKRIKLRPFQESDIDDYIRWNTIETEWMDWDAPWEENDFDVDVYRKNSLQRLESNRPFSIYSSREIELLETGEHIGRINAYDIDDNCNYSADGTNLTIGIDVFDPAHRKKGYATEAWLLHIDYLIHEGHEDIYTQTWSGNEPVIALIKKLGFELYHTEEAYQIVKNQKVDGLTFQLNRDKFQGVLEEWEQNR